MSELPSKALGRAYERKVCHKDGNATRGNRSLVGGNRGEQPTHAMKFIRAQAAIVAVAASILVVGYF